MNKLTNQRLAFFSLVLSVLFGLPGAFAQTPRPLPVIDMHLHALPVGSYGPPPVGMCAPFSHWSTRDPKQPGMSYYMDVVTNKLHCRGKSFSSPTTDPALMQETFAVMKKYNVYGVTSGPFQYVQQWKTANPSRIIPAILFDFGSKIPPETLRRWFSTDSLKVFGEITTQYEGIALSDSIMEPYLAMAEALDVPVSVHVGPGPPGVAYFGDPRYRARLHSALVVEEALMKHPKLRVILAHAGWPMLDDLKAVLYAHPQVYVDLGIICYAFPKAEFYGYLKQLVEAGFEKRICFGSDQMIWPQAIAEGIETINKAVFLTEAQKRDILFNNAARFLRLTDAQLKKYQ
jgi:uncharacterized protein